ncbi:MAG: glycerol-3-phosphate dehydrogenase/oxidase [Omnitrophica bacterium]|nr:glycerol-3-phosphate dehydrogenase/oxidase [Candidatus Omnitrophota bacterium]
MERNFDKFIKKEYDLLVVGGGINGAGLAHLAGDHGLKAALLEKGDFASATSGKSTKLIHGGIRYLENFDFGLVKESLKERAIQLKAAPHLVRPLSFIIPVYKGDKRPLWMMKLGVFLYEGLAGKRSVGKHRRLSAVNISELVPGIRREGLLGGVLYYDAQMDDARLCLENVLSAVEKGADIANYVEVVSFLKEGGKATGVLARDVLGGAVFKVRAKKIVCAVGPWANHLLKKDSYRARKIIRTTKGAHIVYKGKFSDHALLLPSDRDGRIFFVIPWMGHSLIGTTDTSFAKNPDRVETSPGDIRYLSESTKRVFPDRDFSGKNIITSFAGLRPLIRRKGSPSKVTRSHALVETKSGLVFVTGGKYTTYRKIAEDTLRKVFNRGVKKPFRLYGGGKISVNRDHAARKYNVDPNTITFLMGKYGARYEDVLAFVEKDKSLAERICDCSPAIRAQIAYSVGREMALTADDIILRRLTLQFFPCKTNNCRIQIAQFMQKAQNT